MQKGFYKYLETIKYKLCIFLVFLHFKMTNLSPQSLHQTLEKGAFGRALKVRAVRGKKDKAGENCC